jgi:polyisoprenoid-binding protein YceI
MSTTAEAPLALQEGFEGTFNADPVHSFIGFAVRYQGATLYRGTFSDVTAQLVGEDGDLNLEGTAKVESISITNPPQFRQHVLAEDFFDADNYPEISFLSSDIQLSEDNTATVQGELTIKDVTKAVTATGSYGELQEDAFGNVRGSLELETTIDRREFGMGWNAPLPKGGDVLSNEVVLTVSLQLVKE